MSLKGINAYKKGNLKQDVANADPHKLTLMLLQGALDRIAYAKGAMERKELQEKAHLRDTLDVKVGGEVAENMFALYEFMIEKLNEAHVNNDIKLLDEVSSLLSPIRDAWVQIPQEAKEEAFRAQRESKQAI